MSGVARGDRPALHTVYDMTSAKLFATIVRIVRERERAEDRRGGQTAVAARARQRQVVRELAGALVAVRSLDAGVLEPLLALLLQHF